MKTSGYLILYISESEDFELWRALTQLSPDERAAFVKSALKKALGKGSDLRPNSPWSKQDSFYKSEKSGEQGLLNDLAIEELGYNEPESELTLKPLHYFYNEIVNTREGNKPEGNARHEDGEHLDLVKLNQAEANHGLDPVTKGLNFLLNNVIGEEDDEKVIEFIRKAKTQ
ncbi:MAG TPA: hypothetical protein GXX46_12200 [Peptococcaceae bacterium]|nr:hypothetical protein [Peptococcaceae bacterium]